MPTDTLLHTNREAIFRIAAYYGVQNVRVFGSRTRGDASETSDMDLLIEPGPTRSFFFPGDLIADLEDLLGRRVDVVTPDALHPALRHGVLGEAIAL
ncbi:MAG: nucleotidyltransferase family protein [Bacteroidetes bacterium]|nr:nucleotidyltransferase family protein [Bacteroidota bacterium]MCH8030656.1 nucleotidyltransferase family protein [Bacteroidota bacterium]